MTVASFFGGTCKYLGSISNDGVNITNGTYQCADFTSGTWTLQKMMLVETTNIYISLLRGDGLVKSMIGMKVSN
jgi:hypothetical protein